MKKSHIIVIAIITFILGLVMSRPLNGIYQIFRSETPTNCVGKRICVGESSSVIFGLYTLYSIGGLDSIFCGKPYDTGNIEYIFLRDILEGAKCDRPQYSLDFRTNTTRTNITIKENVIIEITQGPLHTLDP